MDRRRHHCIAILTAGLVLATTARAADEVKKPATPSATTEELKKTAVPPTGFYRKFLEPRMTSKLTGDVASAAEFADRSANPWTRDDQAVSRIQKNAISATKRALKQYAIASLRVDAWSVPLFKTGSGFGTVGGQDSRARLRFGISHMTPRADIQIPSGRGNASFSIDARGAMDMSYESKASNFGLGVSYDVPAHTAFFTLSRRF